MAEFPVKVGIIGLGVMGERLMNAFFSHPEVRIVALCDTVASRAEQVSAQFGGIEWHTDYRELLKDNSIQLVYVAVPPKFHHQIVMDAIAANKHVLCEKPLANSLQEAEEMADAAAKAGIINAMNFPTYYRTVYQELKKHISSGYLGQLRRIEIVTHFHQWPRPWQQTPWIAGREQGGFVREVFPHFIHLTHELFGRIEQVDSELEYPDDPAACETSVMARAKLHDGTPVLVNGVSQIAMPEHLSYTLYGTEGTLSLVNWSNLRGSKYGEPLADLPVPENDRLSGLVSNLINAFKGTDAELISFKTGLEVQRVLEALLRS